MSELVPHSVISYIFSRLPVKSLLRFRCVSKHLCALIDSPFFINSHLHSSLETNTNLTILTTSIDCSRIYSIDFDLRAATFINHPFEHRGAHFLGSCNGLISLLAAASIDKTLIESVIPPDPPNLDIVLVNPSTRNHKILPVSQIQYPPYYTQTACEYITYGFGYNSDNDDYKVVRIAQFCDVGKNEVKVYSLRFNVWKTGKEFPHLLSCTSHGVFLNGALHWLVYPNYDLLQVVIATFDLATEEYGLLPPPPLSRDNPPANLRELGGKLCMQCNYGMRCIEIWVMEKYGVKESWTKILSVVQNVDFRFMTLKPLAYSNDGKKVLLEQELGQLLWYDLKLKVINKIRSPVIPEFWKSYVSLESLVKLSCDANTDLTNAQRKTKKRDNFLSKGFKLAL